VTSGASAAATITGTAPTQTLNLTLPKGDKGDTGATGATGAAGSKGETGAACSLTIGTVTTGAAGSSASATITGTAPNQTISLTIPRGDKGDTGATGSGGGTDSLLRSIFVPPPPTSVTATAGNGQASVSWTAPTGVIAQAPVTDYTVQYSGDGGSTWTTFTREASATTSGTVTGLSAGAYLFRVAAVNAIGTGSYSAASSSVTILGLPGAPTGVTATASTAQASVSWSAPSSNGGAAITDYTVQYSSNGGSTWTTFTRAASATTSDTVTGLGTGSYIFRVAAVNSVGAGSYSSPSGSVSVSGATTPGTPTSLTAALSGANPGWVSLSWSAPSSNGGASITDYTVQFSSDSGTTWTTFNDGTSTATTATVKGLTLATNYTFRVAAVNSVGTGSYSAASSSVTPIGVADPPTNVVGTAGNLSVALSWSAPSNNNGAAITDYWVQYTTGVYEANPEWTNFYDGVSNSTTANVTGLTPGIAHRFRVAAVNAAGLSDWAYTNSNNIIPQSTPSAPTNLSATAGDSQASLVWSYPASNGAAVITDYTVQYSSNGGTTWTTFTRAASTSLSATVTGLTNGTAYVFRAAAVNANGTSAFTAASSSVTPAASFTATAVLLTSGTSYTVPSGATSMKAWAVGGGQGWRTNFGGYANAAGVAYKTWSVSGGATVAYSVGSGGTSGMLSASGVAGTDSTVTFSGTTITGGGGKTQNKGGTFSGGDGGSEGGLSPGNFSFQGTYAAAGGAVGGNGTRASCGRYPATDISGLLAAVALAGGKSTEDCGATAAFGSGAAAVKYGTSLAAGYGGGAAYIIGATTRNGGGGAVVLYFT
jgi:titin